MPNLEDIPVGDLWRCFPHLFAERLSDGRWKPYSYLKLLSQELVSAISSGGGRILVQMPPRSGKSEFLSFWLPIWYLNLF